ncbi:hypothetical protein MKX03_023361 [Papaver bracteatum]|nr:hypothetical protein MKX03_023361 [Papaver bracteatum]
MATKRCWNAKEDEKLVECLQEMARGGHWKDDTGFRSGYLQHVEQMPKEKLPNAGIRADPHIESRIKHLKKQTFAIAIAEVIALGSGIIFDESEKMIKCEKSAFDEWVKVCSRIS